MFKWCGGLHSPEAEIIESPPSQERRHERTQSAPRGSRHRILHMSRAEYDNYVTRNRSIPFTREAPAAISSSRIPANNIQGSLSARRYPQSARGLRPATMVPHFVERTGTLQMETPHPVSKTNPPIVVETNPDALKTKSDTPFVHFDEPETPLPVKEVPDELQKSSSVSIDDNEAQITPVKLEVELTTPQTIAGFEDVGESAEVSPIEGKITASPITKVEIGGSPPKASATPAPKRKVQHAAAPAAESSVSKVTGTVAKAKAKLTAAPKTKTGPGIKFGGAVANAQTSSGLRTRDKSKMVDLPDAADEPMVYTACNFVRQSATTDPLENAIAPQRDRAFCLFLFLYAAKLENNGKANAVDTAVAHAQQLSAGQIVTPKSKTEGELVKFITKNIAGALTHALREGGQAKAVEAIQNCHCMLGERPVNLSARLDWVANAVATWKWESAFNNLWVSDSNRGLKAFSDLIDRMADGQRIASDASFVPAMEKLESFLFQ